MNEQLHTGTNRYNASRGRRGSDYSNGYIGKIEYWAKKLVQASETHMADGTVHNTPPDIDEVNRVILKLNYFSGRQAEWLEKQSLKPFSQIEVEDRAGVR